MVFLDSLLPGNWKNIFKNVRLWVSLTICKYYMQVGSSSLGVSEEGVPGGQWSRKFLLCMKHQADIWFHTWEWEKGGKCELMFTNESLWLVWLYIVLGRVRWEDRWPSSMEIEYMDKFLQNEDRLKGSFASSECAQLFIQSQELYQGLLQGCLGPHCFSHHLTLPWCASGI